MAIKKTTGKAEAETKDLEKEIEKNIKAIAKIEEAQRDKRTVGEKISEAIAAFCGSMVFVYVHVVWFGVWIGVNVVPQFQFDPFPFTFLTLVVSLEAIFLSTFILISQNHETQVADRRNHLDLQINMLAEQENTKMIELLQLIATKVGVEMNDLDTQTLLQPMRPDRIVEQIKTAHESK